MNNTELLTRLRELHQELSAINIDVDDGEAVDDNTIDALGQLATDIGRLVDQAKSSSEKEFQDEHKDLLDRVLEFEQEHPKVSQFLTQMTDLLGMMGI